MNNLFKLIGKAGVSIGSKARTIWSKIGLMSTAKIVSWASKNKGWLQTVGLATVSASAGALTSNLVSYLIQAKEAVAQKWMDQTGESTPERATFRKRMDVIGELRDCLNLYSSYQSSDRDDKYQYTTIRMLELINFLIYNESDEEVRRVAMKAATIIPGCLDAGQYPEEGFTNPLIIRTLRNLSEDSMSAEDIEGSIDCVLDICESGAPLKTV